MLNRWNDSDARRQSSDLGLRAYSSRLIGEDPELVLHGGGDTSIKAHQIDRFGTEHDAIWVKASGYDLGRMWTEGFTGLKLAPLLQLARLDYPFGSWHGERGQLRADRFIGRKSVSRDSSTRPGSVPSATRP